MFCAVIIAKQSDTQHPVKYLFILLFLFLDIVQHGWLQAQFNI